MRNLNLFISVSSLCLLVGCKLFVLIFEAASSAVPCPLPSRMIASIFVV